jgi:hypothetical protein
MKRWRWPIALGCAGMLFLCLGLPAAPYLWRVQSATLARQRWERNGSENYTVIVTKGCFCPDSGEYKLTARDGAVTAVEATGASSLLPTGQPLVPAQFGDLTVGAVLSQAERGARASWNAPWLSTFAVTYDPKLGYVTRLSSDLNGTLTSFFGYVVFDAQYAYTARDLQIDSP